MVNPLHLIYRAVHALGWRSLALGIELMSRKERRQGLALSAVIAVSKAFEMAALASVMPVVGLIVQPDLLETSNAIQILHAAFGAPEKGSFILILATLSGILLLLGNASEFVVGSLIMFFTSHCENRLAHDLMEECALAPYSWFVDRNSVSLSRLFQQEINVWAREFLASLLNIFNQFVTIVVGAGIIIYVMPLLAFVALGVVGVLAGGLMVVIRPYSIRWSARRLKAANDAMLISSDLLAGVKDFKLSGDHINLIDVFTAAFTRRSIAAAHQYVWNQVPSRLMLTVGQLGLLIVAVVLWRSGIPNGEMVAQMAVMVLITSRVLPAASRMFSTINAFWSALPWVVNIVELRRSIGQAEGIDRETGGSAPVPKDWQTITLDNVRFHFPDSDAVIADGIALTLEHGKQYGLIGPSGSGKSTLVDLITRLLQPTGGSIRVDGVNLEDIDGGAWRRQIGYVAQTPYFSDDSVRANIAFGIPAEEIDDDRIWWALEQARLDDVICQLPGRLDTRLGERSVKFSGGQRQRLAIARALYKRPRLLILDEATSALDQENEASVLDAIEALRGTMTVLSISHRASAVQRQDVVFALDSGQLVEQPAQVRVAR